MAQWQKTQIQRDNGMMADLLPLRIFKKNDTFAFTYKKCPYFRFLKNQSA